MIGAFYNTAPDYECRDEALKSLPQFPANANSIQLETAAYNRSNTGVSDHVVLCVCMCVH